MTLTTGFLSLTRHGWMGRLEYSSQITLLMLGILDDNDHAGGCNQGYNDTMTTIDPLCFTHTFFIWRCFFLYLSIHRSPHFVPYSFTSIK